MGDNMKKDDTTNEALEGDLDLAKSDTDDVVGGFAKGPRVTKGPGVRKGPDVTRGPDATKGPR